MIRSNGFTPPDSLQLLAGKASNTSKKEMARTATAETETPRKPRKPSQRKQVARNGKAHAVARPRQAPTPLDQFGFRTGSLKSKAAAMFASKKGATLAEVKAALNSSQFNVLSELEARKGLIIIERTLVEGIGPRKVTRYRVVVK